MQTQNRLNYIDVCKALGIILVILGHTYGIPTPVYQTIYSFHMPLFFILAGFVYNVSKNNAMGFGRFVVKIFKQYLIPYFVFCFANLGIQTLWRTVYTRQGVNTEYFLVNLRGIFLCYSDMENTPNCSPVWFLMCLFFASILLWWFMKLRWKYSWIPAVGCVAFNYLCLPFCKDHTSFPFKFPTFLMAAFFLYVGVCLRKLAEKQTDFSKHRILLSFGSLGVLILCFATTVLTNNVVGMNENHYGNYLVFLMTSVLSSIALILFFKENRFLENKGTLWLGRNTLYIIGFNYVCRDLAIEIYCFIPVVKNYPVPWTIHFLFTFIVCLLCIWMCSKIKLLYHRIFVFKKASGQSLDS